MMMVPGILSGGKLVMLSVAGFALALSLGIGAWRLRTTDSPITAGSLYASIAVILLIQLGMCVIGIARIAIEASH